MAWHGLLLLACLLLPSTQAVQRVPHPSANQRPASQGEQRAAARRLVLPGLPPRGPPKGVRDEKPPASPPLLPALLHSCASDPSENGCLPWPACLPVPERARQAGRQAGSKQHAWPRQAEQLDLPRPRPLARPSPSSSSTSNSNSNSTLLPVARLELLYCRLPLDRPGTTTSPDPPVETLPPPSPASSSQQQPHQHHHHRRRRRRPGR
ncbi:uncharacterized protein PSFLO_05606 [Pseudozyma flocculosa]|uniref:Uncharacterized protein n=1 Tax=Pseudozyma flocculosa TaxID=84751 RepID=A0A5C3F6H0_9BASI|nr:uncharacterized protein PSFLO_05606 [Pseudozyma flocculosa]